VTFKAIIPRQKKLIATALSSQECIDKNGSDDRAQGVGVKPIKVGFSDRNIIIDEIVLKTGL
jgi:hypothetical protein